MSPDNHRHERVGEEIAHEINVMLAGELKDPRLEVSVIVSEVRVQPDMKHARVFVSVPHTTNKGDRGDQSVGTRFGVHSQSWWSGCNCAASRSCTLRWTFLKNMSSASNSCSRK